MPRWWRARVCPRLLRSRHREQGAPAHGWDQAKANSRRVRRTNGNRRWTGQLHAAPVIRYASCTMLVHACLRLSKRAAHGRTDVTVVPAGSRRAGPAELSCCCNRR